MEIIGGTVDGDLHYEVQTKHSKNPDRVEAVLQLSDKVTVDQRNLPDFIKDVEQTHQSRELGLVLGEAEQTQDSLRVLREGQEAFLPLLSAPVYQAVELVVTDEVSEAMNLLRSQYDNRLAWKFRNDCRDTLSFNAFIKVLDALAAQGNEFEHVQFRSRLGYFAKRIGDDVPQGIHSVDVLKERVNAWNHMDNLGSVELSEVLSEKLGRRWFRDAFGDERAVLTDIGFDRLC